MPVTFAHPLAALPFRRLGLPTSALVAGAMAPDLAYILPFDVPWFMRHNFVGLFVFATPVALLGLWLHSTFAVRALAALTSAQTARAQPAFRFLPAARFGALALAAFVGAATHVLLDECTHYYGWVAKTFVILRDPLPIPWPEPLPGYKVLQYGLSAAGTLALVWIGRGWLRGAWREARAPHRLRRIGTWAALVVTASLLAAMFGAASFEGWLQVRVLGVRLVVGLMSFGYGSLLLYGGLLRSDLSDPAAGLL